MNCSEFEPDLGAYLDDELIAGRAREVWDHLKVCPGCREEIEMMRAAREAFAGLAPDQVSSDFSRKVRAAVDVPVATPVFPWRRALAPMALAASVALVFLWKYQEAPPTGPPVPFVEHEIYEQLMTMDPTRPEAYAPCLDPKDTDPGDSRPGLTAGREFFTDEI